MDRARIEGEKNIGRDFDRKARSEVVNLKAWHRWDYNFKLSSGNTSERRGLDSFGSELEPVSTFGNKVPKFHRRRRITWLPERQSFFREGLCS